MNKYVKVIFISIVILVAFAAAALAECSYFDQYGDHDWKYGRNEATCQSTGEVYRDCSVCGFHEVQQTLPTSAHSWSDPVQTKTPGCTEEGETTVTCLVCGAENKSAVSALGHVWSEYAQTVAPSCGQKGEKQRTCSRCGAVEKQSVDALEHDWGKVELTVKPTCTSEGEQLIACSICNAQRTEPVGMLEHDYGEWNIAREASCTSAGLRNAVCSMCRKSINESIEREPHEYGEWIVTEEPTGSTMGRRYRKCEVCGATNEESFYPEGTLYRGMYKNDAVYELQQMLIDMGFLAGEPDGLFGANTEKAVKDAQKFAELEETGVVYPETLEAIRYLWQMLGEVNITFEGGADSDYCYVIIGDDGSVEISLCENHRAAVLQAMEMYSDDISSTEYLTTLESEYALWDAQLQEMVNDFADATGDNSVGEMVSAFLEAKNGLIDTAYADNLSAAQKKKNEAIRSMCFELCELLNQMK